MKVPYSKSSQLQSLNLLEFALSIQTLYEQSVCDFLIFILRYSVFTETYQKSRISCDENRAQFSVKYAIRETPVNFLDPWGVSDASVLTQVWAVALLEPTVLGEIVAAVVTAVVVAKAIDELIDNNILQEKKKDTSKIDNKKPAKGNKVPPDQQPVEPTGKGANAGVEKIPKPSQLGEPGNIPPDVDPKGAVIVGAALVALGIDNIPKEPEISNKEINTSNQTPEFVNGSPEKVKEKELNY